jgi:hypothetical protein
VITIFFSIDPSQYLLFILEDIGALSPNKFGSGYSNEGVRIKMDVKPQQSLFYDFKKGV